MKEVTKKTILLDLVEQYPETEDIIRQYDQAAGTCMLCHCLFDSIEIIESTYDIDLTSMINKLNDMLLHMLKFQQMQLPVDKVQS